MAQNHVVGKWFFPRVPWRVSRFGSRVALTYLPQGKTLTSFRREQAGVGASRPLVQSLEGKNIYLDFFFSF